MPVNAASQSIHLSEELAQKHDVQFFVHSRLTAPDTSLLEEHLEEHQGFLRSLKNQGALAVAGPFFTPDGQNTGNGFYVLRADDLEAAAQIAAEDPLHKAGIRAATIEPWLQALL